MGVPLSKGGVLKTKFEFFVNAAKRPYTLVITLYQGDHNINRFEIAMDDALALVKAILPAIIWDKNNRR